MNLYIFAWKLVPLQAPVQPTSNPSPPFHVFCVLISIMIVIADVYLIQCCLLAVVLSTSDFAYTTEPSIPEPSHPTKNTANTQVNRYTCSVACQCNYLISRSHGSFPKDLDTDIVKTTCWSLNPASEWGWEMTSTTLTAARLSEGLVWVFKKLGFSHTSISGV